jgi:SAM-dependent methyltransferase
VLGVDISAPMLELARTRASAFANVTFTLADASAHPFEAAFDLVFSRFGVMFFRDPVGAFANLRRALRPGGRVAFVCWGPVVENPWFRIPLAAVGTVLSLPTPASPDEPGPFAFADRDRLVRILEEAGFTRITLDRSTPELVLGDDLDAAATYAIETGPVSRILVDADEATRGRARTAIRQSLEPYAGPHGVALGSSTWVVRANGG